MEMLLKNNDAMTDELCTLIGNFRMECAEKLISDLIYEKEENLKYIGDLNKYDPMF